MNPRSIIDNTAYHDIKTWDTVYNVLHYDYFKGAGQTEKMIYNLKYYVIGYILNHVTIIEFSYLFFSRSLILD